MDFRPVFLKPQPTHKFRASSWKFSAIQIFGANHSLTHVLKQTWIYFGVEYKTGMTLKIKQAYFITFWLIADHLDDTFTPPGTVLNMVSMDGTGWEFPQATGSETSLLKALPYAWSIFCPTPAAELTSWTSGVKWLHVTLILVHAKEGIVA